MNCCAAFGVRPSRYHCTVLLSGCAPSTASSFVVICARKRDKISKSATHRAFVAEQSSAASHSTREDDLADELKHAQASIPTDPKRSPQSLIAPRRESPSRAKQRRAIQSGVAGLRMSARGIRGLVRPAVFDRPTSRSRAMSGLTLSLRGRDAESESCEVWNGASEPVTFTIIIFGKK
jgi:hypothetical protein